MKPNGTLFVSTINRTLKLKSYGIAIIGVEHISGKIPIGTHHWNQFWSPSEVERMIVGSSDSSDEEDGNMKQIAVNGMVIEPPFLNMKWSLDDTNTDVNWIGACQKKFTIMQLDKTTIQYPCCLRIPCRIITREEIESPKLSMPIHQS